MNTIFDMFISDPLWSISMAVLLFLLVLAIWARKEKRKEALDSDDIDLSNITCPKTVIGKRNKQNYVLCTSEKIKSLALLNKAYSFNADVAEEYEIETVFKSPHQYAHFSFKEKLKEEFSNNPKKYNTIIAPVIENREKYPDYAQKVDVIRSRNFVYENYKLKPELYKSLESQLFERIVLKPVTDIIFFTEPVYITAAGREHYHDTEELDLKDVESLLREIDEEKVSKASRERERSLMSDSLRYDVLKHDKFKCTICGRSAEDGVKLHVDHIIPVSKGGKTEMSNLRTLCDQCNAGKSDKYDENGIN